MTQGLLLFSLRLGDLAPVRYFCLAVPINITVLYLTAYSTLEHQIPPVLGQGLPPRWSVGACSVFTSPCPQGHMDFL